MKDVHCMVLYNSAHPRHYTWALESLVNGARLLKKASLAALTLWQLITLKEFVYRRTEQDKQSIHSGYFNSNIMLFWRSFDFQARMTAVSLMKKSRAYQDGVSERMHSQNLINLTGVST